MIHAGAGMSLRNDTQRAAADALEEAMDALGESGADVAILCATSHHAKPFPEIINSIRSRTHVKALLGATGSGVIGPRGEVENMPGLAVLLIASDRIRAGAALIPRIDSPDTVEHLRGELPSLHREQGILMVIIDPRSMHPEFITRLSKTFPQIPIVGAAAGWCTPEQSATLAADGFSGQHGCAAIHIAGCLEPIVGVAQAVLPESPPRPITRCHANVIEEIETKPAADVLTEFVESVGEDRKRAGPIDLYGCLAASAADFGTGRYIVRNLIAVEPESKSLSIAEYLRPGQYISFGQRSARGSRRSFRQMLERMNAQLSSRAPRACVMFNCCARGQALYGRPHVDLDAYHEFFPELPIVGIFGFSEIGPIFWDGQNVQSAILNHTAVLTIFTEPMELLRTT